MKENPTPQAPSDLMETRRCLLRYPIRADVPRALSAFTSPQFPRYLPLGQIQTADEVRAWIEGAQARWSDGSAFTWSLERKADGGLVGQVTLAQLPRPGVWALAFWIHPDCQGRGYATEAAGKALEFAFRAMGARLVWAGTPEQNVASQRVLEKLHMSYTGDNPAGYTIADEPVPIREFEISAATWFNMRSSSAG